MMKITRAIMKYKTLIPIAAIIFLIGGIIYICTYISNNTPKYGKNMNIITIPIHLRIFSKSLAEESFPSDEMKALERIQEFEAQRIQNAALRDQLQHLPQVQDYTYQLSQLIKKGATITPLSTVDDITGSIRAGAHIPLYRIGEYYMGLCGTQGYRDHHMCIKSQGPSEFFLDGEQGDKSASLEYIETPFYGILIAKKGDTHRLPRVEIQDIPDQGWGYQWNTPYALWMEKSQLFLSVVRIGDGAGSGEGTESVFLLQNNQRELNGCYYFNPDIYEYVGNKLPEDRGLKYVNFIHSVDYISTLPRESMKNPMEQCINSLKIRVLQQG